MTIEPPCSRRNRAALHASRHPPPDAPGSPGSPGRVWQPTPLPGNFGTETVGDDVQDHHVAAPARVVVFTGMTES